MSVRRLAEDAVQPAQFSFSRANAAWAKKKLKDYPKGREASAVIPLLMRAQEQDGWVTKAAIEHVADMLNMPLIRVLEVATFYTQFQLAPVGTKAHIQVCGTTPCMLRGSHDLMKVCKKRINEKPFETNADGTLSWEEVECQGACVNAPMVMIFKDTYEDLTPERLEEIIDAFEQGNGDTIKPGPQIDRIFSAPEGGLTSLTSMPGGKASGSAAASKKAPATGASKKGSARKKAEPQAPTEAARPASHVTMTSPAIDTPVSRGKSEQAQEEATEHRKEAKTRSPKKRASRLASGKDGATMQDPPARKVANKKDAAEPVGIASLSDANRPAPIEKPAEPDDLKLISGVGPKIEGILHGLGIYKFEQIASWKKKERDWVDGYLRFKGRIDREDWVKQAKALAKGGRDEYVRVFGKEPR